MSIRHTLTIGHIKQDAVTDRREVVVERPLDFESVNSIMKRLGCELKGIEFHDNYLVVPWLEWGKINTDSERLAKLLVQELGCYLADIGNGQIIEISDLSISE